MKDFIRESFSRAAKNYEERAELQKEAGLRLLRRLGRVKELQPLLDLGSGTGELLKGVERLSLDISLSMCRECLRKESPSVCGDATQLPFKDGSLKAVFSNFSLQWTQLKESFKEVDRVLKAGGLFFLSLPVEGSLETLFRCFRETGSSLKLFSFPREREAFNLFRERFKVLEFERFTLKRKYSSPREALKRVTGIGARNPFGRASFREVKLFRELFSKEPVIEYKVLILVGKKER